jgi:4-hydroxy-tetrahydrodipicolinate synthase
MDGNSVGWRGYLPAVTTPFEQDGELDREGFAELLDWLAREGMHGVAVAGTTGEWFSLRPEERAELFQIAGARLGGRMTLLAGCNAFTPSEVISHAEHAADAGLDGILLTPPPYAVPSSPEIVAFFRAVSDAVTLPICVYNWPRGTNVDLDVPTMLALAELDRVVAIKNSTGDVGRFLDGLFAVGDRVRYFGVPTSELGITLVRHHGAAGMIGSGGVLGRDHPAFFEHVWAGELDAARACGARDRALMTAWFRPDYGPRFGSSQAIMKAALDLRDVPGGHVRPPLLPLTADERERVRATLASLNLPVADPARAP